MEKQLELLHFNSEEVEDILDVEVIRFSTVSVHEEGIQDPLVRRVKQGHHNTEMASIMIPSPSPSRLSYKLNLWMAAWKFGAKKIDVLSRIFFPLCFAIFNLIYWSYYLGRK